MKNTRILGCLMLIVPVIALTEVIEEWAVRYEGGGVARDIAVDDSGNVYITGANATIKYNADGVEQWVEIQAGASIALDDYSNIYIAGSSNDDYATIKYNTDGQIQWEAYYDGPESKHDAAQCIALDFAGNVYVTGTSERDFATLKYNSAGSEQWVARYNGPRDNLDGASHLEVDNAGNVYAAGVSTGTRYDYAVVKYSPAGEERWVARYDGPGSGSDRLYGLAIDDECNVYVTGLCDVSGHEDFDYATVKYNSEGEEV